MHVLVTGGLGYIGSHTIIDLIAEGFNPIIVDSLVNSKLECLKRIERIAGQRIPFFQFDLRERSKLKHLLDSENVDAVIHFAALKAVGESVREPLLYYDNNVSGTIILLEELERHGIKKFVFSSSATVYGDPARCPIQENFATNPTNPYGRTKLMIEEIGRDLCRQDSGWSICNLRYFNPIGAHESGLIGEDPRGIPNNLLPFVAQVAEGKRPHVNVFGNDWPTPDGTGVRDYIHVVDLARGHSSALKYLENNIGEITINLGTGKGYSVMEIIDAFSKASGKKIPYQVTPRRPGDIATCYADPAFAEKVLGWKARFGLEKMCDDTWNWQSQNPGGFS